MNEKLQTMKAAIFDMDGTLIDSMPCWRQLNAEFVRSRGIEPTPEQEKEMFALTGMQVVSYFKERFGLESDFETLCAQACRAMEPIYAAGVPLKSGAGAYLDRLRKQGVLCVLATATPAKQALIALNRMDLVRRLDYIFSTDLVGGNKGETGFYDRLCGMIGVPKERCVMFEDSLYAMQGARAAGLGVVGITDSTNAHVRAQMQDTCDIVIDSYDELA